MSVSDKLKLQAQFGGVLLFKDGVFLRAYNEGAYILTAILGHNLKIRCLQLKKYHNQWLATCAFPADKLSERLPQAVLTAFGGQLAGDFGMQDYMAWLERRCREESEANVGAKASNESLKTSERLAPSLPAEIGENLNNILLSLSPQQAAYLFTWHKGNYSIEVDLAFIESLKTNLVTSNS